MTENCESNGGDVEPNIDPLDVQNVAMSSQRCSANGDEIQCQQTLGDNDLSENISQEMQHVSPTQNNVLNNTNDIMSPSPKSVNGNSQHTDSNDINNDQQIDMNHSNIECNRSFTDDCANGEERSEGINVSDTMNESPQIPLNGVHEANSSQEFSHSEPTRPAYEETSRISESPIHSDALPLPINNHKTNVIDHIANQLPLSLTAHNSELDMSSSHQSHETTNVSVNNIHSMINSSSLTKPDDLNSTMQNSNNNGLQSSSHEKDSCSNSNSELQDVHSRSNANSIYDFEREDKDIPMVDMSQPSHLMPSSNNHMQEQLQHEEERLQNQIKNNIAMNSLNACSSLEFAKRENVISNMNSLNSLQESGQPIVSSNALNNTLPPLSGNDLLNQSYDSSVSASSSDFPNTATCYDPVLIRRGRGRPRGSKNGSGMGRGRGAYSNRGGYRFNVPDDRTCTAYDLRHISDPFGTARRGRPRSRFIVDLGEQNHEAWTKARIDLNVSDAELTTLLLSL